MISIERIRYFIETAETLSFSRAARNCFVSQTAISQQIAQLERELGTQLFVRQGKTVRLTPAGEHMLPMAKKLCADYRSMISDMERLYAHSDKITLAITGNFEAQLLSLAIPAFRKKYPGIVVMIKKVPSEDIVPVFESGECDLVFAVSCDINAKDVYSTMVIKGRMGIAAANGNPLSGKESVSIAEILPYPIALFRSKPGLKAVSSTIEWAKSIGYKEEDILWADTVDEQQLMVTLNQAISLLPDCIITPGVRVIPISDMDINYSVSVYYRKRTRELSDLVALLKEAGDTLSGNL